MQRILRHVVVAGGPEAIDDLLCSRVFAKLEVERRLANFHLLIAGTVALEGFGNGERVFKFVKRQIDGRNFLRGSGITVERDAQRVIGFVLRAQNVADIAAFAIALQVLIREVARADHVARMVLANGLFPIRNERIALKIVLRNGRHRGKRRCARAALRAVDERGPRGDRAERGRSGSKGKHLSYRHRCL